MTTQTTTDKASPCWIHLIGWLAPGSVVVDDGEPVEGYKCAVIEKLRIASHHPNNLILDLAAKYLDRYGEIVAMARKQDPEAAEILLSELTYFDQMVQAQGVTDDDAGS